MGLPSRLPVHARHRDGPHRRDDRGQAHRRGRRAAGRLAAGLILALWLPLAAAADSLRIATFNADLTRDGPGLLLRDIASGRDPQVEAAAGVIAAAAPDVLLLTGFDYDHGLAALSAFAARLEARGAAYPHLFAFRPNTGRATGLDLDGDGRRGGPRDAQGYGRFAGAEGMAVLSRLPLAAAEARDFSAFLWAGLPGALIDGAGLAAEARAVQRLSTTGHWDVPVILPEGGRLHLLAWHATPPAFDGPEDRNGRRNHDEAAFWTALLDGALLFPPPEGPFVILGDGNLDPDDGEGRREAIRALLADPRLQDPGPESAGGRAAADAGHRGDPARDTVAWGGALGAMRVDYVLPSAGLAVTGAGVWWPEPGAEGAKAAQAASRHRLVWVEVAMP